MSCLVEELPSPPPLRLFFFDCLLPLLRIREAGATRLPADAYSRDREASSIVSSEYGLSGDLSLFWKASIAGNSALWFRQIACLWLLIKLPPMYDCCLLFMAYSEATDVLSLNTC